MRTCSICRETKPLEDFPWKIQARNVRQHECKPCKRERSKAYYRQDPEAQKKRAKRNNVVYYERNKRYVSSIKLACSKCGDSRPYVLDFHHTDPSKKEFLVSNFLGSGYALERLKAEIAKCIVLCSNCHREHHHFEREDQLLNTREILTRV